MFRIKICGVTTLQDGLMIAQAGADAVGLNFYPKSARSITFDRAAEIIDVLPREMIKVGLFVNSEVDAVVHAHDDLGLDLIQLHGDEPPEFLAALESRPVMRAFRLGPSGLTPVEQYLRTCRDLGCPPALVLIDAYKKGLYGGTGKTADWSVAKSYPPGDLVEYPPLVLAGGLTPDNVAGAIRAVHPVAVDTAGGVETSPGVKDPNLVTRFVHAATNAFRGA